MALTPQWLDELRARVTLSTVISRTTKLQKSGHEWKACCPFHNDASPSFTVNDQKGFYHCFGCQAHGDVIRWMTDQRGLGFMDAVKELASEAGMEVPAPDPQSAARAKKQAGLGDVMTAAQDWFVSNLRSDDGRAARQYLQKRGFSPQLAAEFGFGLAPESRTAMKSALSDFSNEMMVECGLRIQVDNKEPYDRFRSRLMLPIQDARGRVIGFGGRIMDAQANPKAPKYLNSPETPLFDKGRNLYNLHRASPASRKTGRVIAVEGYMDVIALAAAGIGEAVAPMGTALTETQIELMWRMVEKPILCFDGDKAGKRAAMRAIARVLPLLKPGHSLQIVQMPTGMDPDDIIKRDGPAAMEKLLANPTPMLEMIWEHESAALPLTGPEDKAGLKARLLAHVDEIQDQDIRSLYRRDLLDRFSDFAFPPRERASFTPFKFGGQKGAGRKKSKNGVPYWQRPEWETAPMSPEATAALRKAAGGGLSGNLAQSIIAGFANHPDQISLHSEALFALCAIDPSLTQAVDMLMDHAETLEDGEKLSISASGPLAPPPDKTHFSFLMEGIDPSVARKDLAEAIDLLVERPALNVAIAAATARFESDPEGAFAEQQRLRKRKLEIDTRLGQMARQRAASADQDMGQPESSEDTSPKDEPSGDTGK